MMTIPINNITRIGISLGLFFSFLFLSIVNVSALSVSNSFVAYGYTQEYNGVVSSRTWVTYNSNNLVKYNYDLPNSSEIDIDTFNFRFHITGNFLRGNNYILTFSWANYSQDGGFSLYYSRMIHSMVCYSSSFSSPSQTANNCFSNYNISYSTTSNIDIINVTLSFTPINDIYGIAFVNEHDNDPYSSFPSDGWEITNINYQLVSSGTSEIIDNATENTENIINNQNSNTQDIIDNQNQNAEDIQNTINNNFQTCRNSYNLMPTKDVSLDLSNHRTETILLGSELSAGTYTISYDYFSTNNPTTNIAIQLIGASGNAAFVTLSNNGKNTFTATTSFNRLYFFITTSSPSGSSANINNIMLVTGSISKPYEPYNQQICTNKLDEQNNAINGINDSITDNTPPDTNELSNATGWLPPGPVDSILNLPLTLLQSLNNAFSNNSCQPINVNLPYVNTPLTIPCMSSVWEGFGLLPLFTWIGRVLGGVLLYKYLIGLYKWVDDTLTMRENNNFDDGSLG